MSSESTTEDAACVYILQCRDGSFYTGWTIDIGARLSAHNQGRASKYTRSRLPVALVYLQPCSTRREARQREVAIKRLNRQAKLGLMTAKF